MSSRSNRELSVLWALDDHGVQEAESIIDKARRTSVVMTETAVQEAEEERNRRRDKARTGRSVDPVRRSASEALVKGPKTTRALSSSGAERSGRRAGRRFRWTSTGFAAAPTRWRSEEMTKVKCSWPQLCSFEPCITEEL